MAKAQAPAQPPVRRRPAKEVAPSTPRSRSEPGANPPAVKRRRSGKSPGQPEGPLPGAPASSGAASSSSSSPSLPPIASSSFFAMMESGGASQFSSMFKDLKSGDSSRQILALTELSEYLSYSSEEALISFPMETFIPALVNLLENAGHSDEAAAQVMLLCCRCLFNVVDVLPPTTRIITAAGGLPVLCANLLNVEYIDVAELAVSIVECICEDQPLQVLKAGGLQAIVTFLDFFQMPVQRQAANAAALMLLPVPTAEILEQHIKPVLPTLATLLQHSDPLVAQSACECWRRVLDNTIALRTRPSAAQALDALSMGPFGRLGIRGKWNPLNSDRQRRTTAEELLFGGTALGLAGALAAGPPRSPEDADGALGLTGGIAGSPDAGSAAASTAGAAAAEPPLAVVLEEMCPSGVLSSLQLLVASGIASPVPQNSVIVAEVLYILAVLTDASEAFTEDVLKQDLSGLLRQMVLGMGFCAGGDSALSQSSSGVLRVLGVVASLLPAVDLSESSVKCQEKRAALFRDKPEYLTSLVEAFAPLLLDIYVGSVDPSVQSLCVTLLLTFILTCRDRPELVKASFDSTRVACFLANLLHAGTSRSQCLACLLVTHELLERHGDPYSFLFVRHGVVRAIHFLATHSHTESSMAPGTVAKKTDTSSSTRLLEEVAHRILSSYFASSSSHVGESPTLRELSRIAKKLQSSPDEVIAAHREAFVQLKDLLHSDDGVTTFELTCSGVCSALCAYFFPQGQSVQSQELSPDPSASSGARLRLFMECFGGSPDFGLLVRLCVDAVCRSDQPPLALFPTGAGMAVGLPPHLRSAATCPAAGPDMQHPSGYSGRSSRGAHDAAASTSTLLSVLKLLAKPVRVRVGSQGARGGAISRENSGREGPVPAVAVTSTSASSAGAVEMPPPAVAGMMVGPGGQAMLASPATRLRNYLASKVTRKRSGPSTSSDTSSSAPAEKRGGGVGGLLGRAGPGASAMQQILSRGDGKSLAARLSALSGGDDPWSGGLPWDPEDEDMPFVFGLDRHDKDRDRPEPPEAVLLVEPFTTVSALEDYLWEKHGPKAAARRGSSPPNSRTQAGSARSAAAALAAAGAVSEGVSGSAAVAGAAGQSESLPSTPSRLRISSKQPSGVLNTTADGDASPSSAHGDQSPTPLAMVDPSTPSGATKVRPSPFFNPGSGGASEAASAAGSGMGSSPAAAAAAAARGAPAGAVAKAKREQRVRLYLNGKQLPSTLTIVQSLVHHAPRVVPAQSPLLCSDGPAAAASASPSRFMVTADDPLVGDSDGSAGGGGGGQLAGVVWGRVHTMSYDFVADPEQTDEPAKSVREAAMEHTSWSSLVTGITVARTFEAREALFVPSEYEAMVRRQADIAARVAVWRVLASAGAAGEGLAVPVAESQDNSAEGSTPCAEKLSTMLQLISVLFSVREHLQKSQGVDAAGLSDEAFHCGSMTSALLRQLSDPLAVCTGSVPPWCVDLAASCGFLLPRSVRRIVHQSCSLGLPRALQHVQQRALAQFSHSPELQRRLEGEVAVAAIPRQKVRISRQRMLESAVKVMNLYGSGAAILEVEYVGEVGTGSGPTLEFYAQVSDILRTSDPKLFREDVPLGMLFPAPRDAAWMKSGVEASVQIIERFRLLGQVVAKCILDGRLVDMQLHPLFWRCVLGREPLTQRSLSELDPPLYNNLEWLRGKDNEALGGLCVNFTLPGHPDIELVPGGADVMLSQENLEDYINKVAEMTLVTAVVPQIQAFRTAFEELLPLKACAVWSDKELASIIVGASVRDDACWTQEHLTGHIKAQHGYNSESRCFRDLLATMTELSIEERRRFLAFVTGAPSLPVGGFKGLKPPLTVVKKEAPPAPQSPDQFMPSVMTCANYLKLPEYSSVEILKQKLLLAMTEGQSAFLLS